MMTAIKTVLFVTAALIAAANQFIFWMEMEPQLRKLGYQYDFLSLRNYPKGMRTLWEYRQACLAEQKSLRWWWLYWGLFWLLAGIFPFWAMVIYMEE